MIERREAFQGGERYYCEDCGTLVLERRYPTTEVYSSAEPKGLVEVTVDQECNCERGEEKFEDKPKEE